MIQDVSLCTAKEERALLVEHQKKQTLNVPEPFEQNTRAVRYQERIEENVNHKNVVVKKADLSLEQDTKEENPVFESKELQRIQQENIKKKEKQDETRKPIEQIETSMEQMQQLSMPIEKFISKEARKKHRLIGQVFKTYWMIEYDEKMYIVDQHAAHEKVMFERLMKQMSDKKVISQQLLPAKILHLNSVEHTVLMNHFDMFLNAGFEIEDFGDDSIVVRAMPDDIMGVDPQALFDALLNALTNDLGNISIDFFVEKLSGMACKAAIKGNTEISTMEADTLIDELLKLKNPYNCPHGRPTMIALTKAEIERKFKRIQDK